jgi:hypothetical protein
MSLTVVHKRLIFVTTLVLIIAGLACLGQSASAAPNVSFTFINNGTKTIWVGALGNAGQQTPNGGGWAMAPKSQRTISLPGNWGGRFWGRTGCVFNAAGQGACETGDCGKTLLCAGRGGAPPASLAEFTLQQATPGASDFYDVSYVDGYNLPLTIKSVGGSPSSADPYRCTDAGCGVDLNPKCPAALQLRNGAGQIVGCKSACEQFNTDQYCCRGAFGTPNTCRPNTWPVNYAAYFKSACPRSYSYAYDDPTSTFTCTNCSYQIIFGPVSGGGGPSTSPSTPVTRSPSASAPAGGGGNAYDTIQAESYSAQSGTATEATTDTGGGKDLTHLANGDWAQYNNVSFGTPAATQFLARVASGAPGGVSGLIEVRLDSRTSAPIGSFAIANTGGWQNWRTVPANIAAVTGAHTVFLTFTSGQPAEYVNVNWFTFNH